MFEGSWIQGEELLTVTVAELIEKLKDYPEDYRVILVASYDDGYCSTNSLLEEVLEDNDAVYLISNQE